MKRFKVLKKNLMSIDTNSIGLVSFEEYLYWVENGHRMPGSL